MNKPISASFVFPSMSRSECHAITKRQHMCISNVSFIEALDYKVLQTSESPLPLKKSEMFHALDKKFFRTLYHKTKAELTS